MRQRLYEAARLQIFSLGCKNDASSLVMGKNVVSQTADGELIHMYHRRGYSSIDLDFNKNVSISHDRQRLIMGHP